MSNKDYKIGDIVEFSFVDEDFMLVHGKGILGVKASDYQETDFSVNNVEYFEDSECKYNTLNIYERDIVGKIN